MDTDVIVIGVGLAGLQDEGLTVVVLEREDAIGDRTRTDHIDDFLLDRGFQVLNPAYRAVRDWVGVMLRDDRGISTLAHPLRHPGLVPQTLRSGCLRPGELFALARWPGPALALDRVGITGPLRHGVLDTFLAGVLADDHGTSSVNFVRLLLRAFTYGKPGLPRDSMQALPEQLAATPYHRPLTGHEVTGDLVVPHQPPSPVRQIHHVGCLPPLLRRGRAGTARRGGLRGGTVPCSFRSASHRGHRAVG